MKTLSDVLQFHSKECVPILDGEIPLNTYTPINLSDSNPDLALYDITDPDECQAYINGILVKYDAKVAYGGYLEKRNLYNDKVGFSGDAARNIHLGIDFWAKAGTKVVVPLNGTVHSFQNNTTVGDYGPTIILQHKVGNQVIYSLYGHLSLVSLEGLTVGKTFRQGETLATLGTPDINVNYAPHLHFQLIQDLEGNKGDYPGVCAQNRLEFYTQNCPDPDFLLKISP